MSKHALTAVIYDKRGRVLSIGRNSYTKTHTLQAKYAEMVGLDTKIYLHSEIDAIVKCKHLDKAYRIFVARFGKDGRPLPASPCPICLEAIKHTNIEVIEHT